MKKDVYANKGIVVDDAGSTLITVIVAIAFVTILVSIILGTTLVNVRMKGIDRRTKDDFYYAERSLNDIYTGLGQEMAKVAGDEYDKAFKTIGEMPERDVIERDEDGNPVFDEEGKSKTKKAKVDYNLAENAEKDFRSQFLKKAHDKAEELIAKDAEEHYLLEGYILDTSKGSVDKVGHVEYQKKDGSKTDYLDEAYRVVITNVQVSVEDTAHYRSTISTDIVITPPSVDFLGTNADVSDYGLIANEGLYIDAESGDVTVTGNVYAGVHATAITQDADYKERTDEYSRTPVYGGINIKNGKATFDGNYIVSKGDINLSGDDPQIKVNSPRAEGADTNLANLWFTSLRTITNRTTDSGAQIDESNDPETKPTIDINANVFALNDLALNADNSSAKIKGNYYGYNEGGLPYILGQKEGRYDGQNSAIIINGSNAYLDMKDINNFVLMGKAYIDFTSDTGTDADAMVDSSLTQVVPTAEGVALKTNQQLYLVPPDFIDGPNPVQGGTGKFTISISDTDLKKWFGYKYLASAIDSQYKVETSEGPVYYDYLVFHDNKTDGNINWKPEEVTLTTLPANTEDVTYIATKKSDGTFKVIRYKKDTAEVGTGGSISSQAMFYLNIMTSESTYEFKYEHGGKTEDGGYSKLEDYIAAQESKAGLIQPSAYRLYERINGSMNYDYFDLSQCVVGDTENVENAHYYAKNAVINYEKSGGKIKSNVLNNTDGMFRYANYRENLYKRYILLCTKLDPKADFLLNSDPAPSKDVKEEDWPEWTVTYADKKKAAPLGHFVDLSLVTNTPSAAAGAVSVANTKGLKTGAYGACVAAKGDLTISKSTLADAFVGDTFKGVAIVDGNITVSNGTNIDGLLMATGTITLEGDNYVTYDKGLIQSRIEKEMNMVKNWEATLSDTVPYKDYYLITYLADDSSGTLKRVYDVTPGSKIKREHIEADYNDFMHYENWQKGE